MCEHGRQRSQCVECGGNGICVHKRIRSRCADCGGSGVCEHGRRRYRCRMCIESKSAREKAKGAFSIRAPRDYSTALADHLLFFDSFFALDTSPLSPAVASSPFFSSSFFASPSFSSSSLSS